MAQGNIIDEFRDNQDDDPIKVPAFRFADTPVRSPVQEVLEGVPGLPPGSAPNVSQTGREVPENEQIAEGVTEEPTNVLFMDNAPYDSGDLTATPEQQPVGQTLGEVENEFISDANEGMQQMGQRMDVSDSVTYGNFFPALYEGPTSEELTRRIQAQDYTPLLNAPASSSSFPSPDSLKPLPQERTNPRQFRPDSTKNAFDRFTNWLRQSITPAPFDPTKGQFGQSGQGVLGGLIYGLGLPFNATVGLLNDISNQRNKFVAKLPKPVQTVLDFNPITAIDKLINGKEPDYQPITLFHDSNPNDSDFINALRGNQQSFSAYKDDPNAIIGIRERNNGLRWWQDPGFLTGLAIDIVADPGDILIDKAFAKLGKKLGPSVPRETVNPPKPTPEVPAPRTAKPVDLTNDGVIHYADPIPDVPKLKPGTPQNPRPRFVPPPGKKLVRNQKGILEWVDINAPSIRPTIVNPPPSTALIPRPDNTGFTSDIPVPGKLPDDVGVIHYADPIPEVPLLPEVAGTSVYKTGNELIPSPAELPDMTVGHPTEPLIHYADPIPDYPQIPSTTSASSPGLPPGPTEPALLNPPAQAQIGAPPELPLLVGDELIDPTPLIEGGIHYPLLPPGKEIVKPVHSRIKQRTIKVPPGLKFTPPRAIEGTTSQAGMPVLDAAPVPTEVFQPLPSPSEVAEALTEAVPGMQVSPKAVRKQSRTLAQLTELAKLTPGPDGKPILPPDAKQFRTWKQVEQRLAGLGDDYARIFDRYGPAIDLQKLVQPEVKIQAPTGEVATVKREPVKPRPETKPAPPDAKVTTKKGQPPMKVFTDPSVIGKTPQTTWKERQWNAAKKAQREYELTGEAQALNAYDDALSALARPSVIDDPDALISIQKTELPSDLHADAESTQAFLDARADFEDASHAVRELSLEYKAVQKHLDESLKTIDTTPDIGRQTDLTEKPPRKPVTPEAQKTVDAATALGLTDVTDPIDAMHKMSMVADWNTELAIREGVTTADYDPVKYMAEAVRRVNAGDELSTQLTLPRVLDEDMYPEVPMSKVDAKARELGYVRPADMKDFEWKSTVLDGIFNKGKPQEVRKYYRKTTDVPRLTGEQIRDMAPTGSLEELFKKADNIGNDVQSRTLKAVEELNKTDNIFDAIAQRRESIREALTPKIQGTFYHGTKVTGLDLANTDPTWGGKRAELGPAHYLTEDYAEATKYSQANVTRDVPIVPSRQFSDQGQVLKVDLEATHKDLIDGNDAPNEKVLEIVRSVLNDVLDPTEPIDKAVMRKFDQGIKRLDKEGRLQMRDVYDQFDKAMANVYKVSPPVTVIDNYQRTLNRELAANGYKGIMYRGDDDIVRLAIFNGEGILKQAGLGVTPPAVDQLDLAVNRFNVDSQIAAANPRSLKAQTDLAESAAGLQSEIGHNTRQALDDAVEGQLEATRKMLVQEDNLKAKGKKAKADKINKAKRVRKAQAEDIEKHLGKPNDNPCSF